MQVVLSAPDITCDHCIATIRTTVDATEGARFLDGDPETRRFTVELTSGGVLDALAVRLKAEGYPLGEVSAAHGAGHDEHHPALTADWQPASYRIEATSVGANVNYDCYCGCDAGFALDRSLADPATESCCCGNQILVGPGAAGRIASKLEAPEAFRVDVQSVTMPWGQPMEVALAIPRVD